MAFDNESICCTSRSQFDCKDDKEKNQEKQQNINIDLKLLNIFDYLKSLMK